MVRLATRLLAAAGSGLLLFLLLLFLLLLAIDPDLELARNAVRLARVLVDLLAAFFGWLAALLEGALR